MSQIVQRYNRNSRGRDFVVGDIHGCFDQLRQALDAGMFVSETDRLFSVGDLIDRGPQSTEALGWLTKPWFHACLGNHEDLALRSRYDESALLSWVLFNGGEWWVTLDSETQIRYTAALGHLPMAMEIETTHGRVGIVHADIPETLSWQTFIDALESGDVAAREIALWSRRRADGLVTSSVEGIDRVVCGHTITDDRKIHRYANVWFIDTGAFLSGAAGGRLTLLALDSLFQDSASTAVKQDQIP
jgi:serine/threonine protein phosphatase 1